MSDNKESKGDQLSPTTPYKQPPSTTSPVVNSPTALSPEAPSPIPNTTNKINTTDTSNNNSSGTEKRSHSRQSSLTLSPTTVFSPYNSSQALAQREMESRGRRSSSTSSSASAAHLRNSVYQSQNQQQPAKFTQPVTSADVFDQMEKEQEAIVNKLQREITDLKTERSRSRSQSTSSSASVSRNASVRSNYSMSETEDLGNKVGTSARISRSSFSTGGPSPYDEQGVVQSLRKENELLKKKLADLSIKLTEKENEIEGLKQHN